jgi:uncharacterized membrane protein YfcA
MPILPIVAIVSIAAFMQSLTGFGFALVVMPLVTIMLGVRTAAPLVALAGLTVYTINLIRYRQAINISEAARLAVASVVGVPIGIWVLSNVDEMLVNRILGLMLVAYAAYAIYEYAARPIARHVPSERWVYAAGFAAGCLGGAYNTPGPPVIVYGSLRQWPKEEFRAVLQTLFFLNATLVVISHLMAANVTREVLALYLYAVPALVVGILAGSRVDRKVDGTRFRIIVVVMILILGLALLLGIG